MNVILEILIFFLKIFLLQIYYHKTLKFYLLSLLLLFFLFKNLVNLKVMIKNVNKGKKEKREKEN